MPRHLYDADRGKPVLVLQPRAAAGTAAGRKESNRIWDLRNRIFSFQSSQCGQKISTIPKSLPRSQENFHNVFYLVIAFRKMSSPTDHQPKQFHL